MARRETKSGLKAPLALCLFLAAAPVEADVSGRVFRDVDLDGVDDGGVEAGVGGLEVRAFGAGDTTPAAADTTAADGTYDLSLPAGDYRVELVVPPSLDHFQPGVRLGGSGNTSVVFVEDGSTQVDFGVVNPGQYCQAEPTLAVNCYLKGPQPGHAAPGEDVLVSFPWTAGCPDEDQDGVCDAGDADSPAPTEIATGAQLGTTWGLAYRRSTDTLFAAAFQKRHTGFRVNGDTGVIYRVEGASQGPGAVVSQYADFDALGIPTADATAFPATGGDPHPAPADTCDSALAGADPGATNRNCWLHDGDSYGQVGRIAFGDLDLSDDESTLWSINLYDKTLYSIPVQAMPVAAGDVDGFPLPTPACAGQLQPFAVAFEDGLVYVGMVCDGPTTGDLAAHVYSFDPDAWTFTEVLDAPLDYQRGSVVASGGTSLPADWQPWSDTFGDVLGPIFGNERALPQPWLTDIEFDRGDMILGIRDRFADMSGFDDGTPDPTAAVTVRGDAAGDTLRACPNGSIWELESDAGCGGTTTGGAGNAEGPGGGEYYFEDRLTVIHDEITLGGLAQVPGAPEVLTSVYDPLNSDAGPDVFSGGVLWLRRTDGEVNNLYRVFRRTDPETFGKAGGLGDVEALCDPAPLEIGNRVWLDANEDGVQDPGEEGLGGWTVLLLEDPDGVCDGGDETAVGSVATSPSGEYVFTDFDVAGGIRFHTGYCLRIVLPAGYAATELDATPIGDGHDDLRDSDGDPTPLAGSVVTSFATGGPGANRHRHDFGLRVLPLDWGDLPDSYGTLAASGGPSHRIAAEPGCFLGGAPDPERDGQPGPTALGDDELDGDDEDGVTFLTPLQPGAVADVEVVSSGSCVLNAWIDFDSDGDFTDAGERLAADLALQPGLNLLEDLVVPNDATGLMAARFRVTDLAGQGGGGPPGPASTGEVEDYLLAAIGDFVWNDSAAGRGIQVGGDPPVAGVLVSLLAGDGVTPIEDGAGSAITTTTRADGGYELPGLPPGDYRVRFGLPASFADFSPRDATTDDLDSDADRITEPTPGLTQGVSLAAGEHDRDLDAGLRAVTAALITSAAAWVEGSEVVFEFSTGYEALSAGFEVLRHDPLRDDLVRVTDDPIPGLLGSPQGGVYRVVDEDAPFAETLSYAIVEHQGNGHPRVHGPYRVRVTPRGERAAMTGSRAARPHVSSRFAARMDRSDEEKAAGTPRRDGPGSGFAAPWELQLNLRETGLYHLSASEMAKALREPEERVRSLVRAGRVALESRGRPVSWRPDGDGEGLVFYGESIDSLYTLDNVYRLRLGAAGELMARHDGRPAGPAPGGSFASSERFERDLVPVITGVRETEVDHWFWGGLNAASSDTVLTFEVDVPDAADGGAAIAVRFAGVTNGPAAVDHHAVVRVGGVEVGTAAWSGFERLEETFSFDGSVLGPRTAVEVETVLDEGSEGSIFFVDGFDLEYRRDYRAVKDRLLARGDDHRVITVEGFTSADVEVLDVSVPERPIRVENVLVESSQGAFRASFAARTPDTPYFVTTTSAAQTGRNLRPVAPAIDLKAADHDYEHVVIAPAAWRREAELLAAYRSGRGMRSLAVGVEDVYDAFSDGLVTPWAVRDFLAHAREHWTRSPDFALVAGRGTLDPRDLLGGGDDVIPVVLVGTPLGLVPTDNVLADLSGDDGIPEVALGRLPIVSAGELTEYVDKLRAYEESTGDWRGRALLLADDPDAAGDFPAQSDELAGRWKSYERELVDLSTMDLEEARAALLTAWNDGVQLVNYVGHGGVTRLAAEGLLLAADVDRLTNGERLPVVSALTCVAGRSDVPNLESLAEALVTDADGGAIAVWAPTGVSHGGAANRLGLSYAKAVEEAAPNTPLGDVVRRALEALGMAGESRETLDLYAIAGDPAVDLP